MVGSDFALLRAAQKRFEARATEVALTNGASRERSLDEVRYYAGMVAGLREGVTLLDNLLTELANDEE